MTHNWNCDCADCVDAKRRIREAEAANAADCEAAGKLTRGVRASFARKHCSGLPCWGLHPGPCLTTDRVVKQRKRQE